MLTQASCVVDTAGFGEIGEIPTELKAHMALLFRVLCINSLAYGMADAIRDVIRVLGTQVPKILPDPG